MIHKNRGTEAKLEALRKIVEQGSKAEAIAALRRALSGKSNFLVSKAFDYRLGRLENGGEAGGVRKRDMS